ncbi:MAG: phage holin family protein [Pirellulales bacterium]
MVEFVLHIVVTGALLMFVANLVSGIEIEDWGSAFLAAFVLGLANAFVRPLLVLLTLPITLLTFGLFLFVINGFMLQFAAALVPGVRVRGCGTAIIGSLILSVLNVLLAMLAGLG